MKIQKSKFILSSFIVLSSALATSSTSLADDLEYKDKVSEVYEKYSEIKEKSDDNIELVNANLENNNTKEQNNTDEHNKESSVINEKETDEKDSEVLDNNIKEPEKIEKNNEDSKLENDKDSDSDLENEENKDNIDKDEIGKDKLINDTSSDKKDEKIEISPEIKNVNVKSSAYSNNTQLISYSNTSRHINSYNTKEEFLKMLASHSDLAMQYNIFPEVMMGQAILESGWGQSRLSKQSKNIFGVKVPYNERGQGKGDFYNTQEYINGRYVTVKAEFRRFNTYEESIRQYLLLLNGNYYSRYGVNKAKDYKEQLQRIKNAGYATDPNYVRSVLNVIEKNVLPKYAYNKNSKNNNISYPKNAWVNKNNGRYYTDSNGNFIKGIYNIGLNKYYFEKDGKLRTNTRLVTNKSAYIIASDGIMSPVINGWLKVNSNSYYANNKGDLIRGIYNIGPNKYYFAKDGKLRTNTRLVTNKSAYIITSDGIMSPVINDWIRINSNYYHTDKEGQLNKGLCLIDNRKYSFDLKFGRLEKNKIYIDNDYIFASDSNGVINKRKSTKTKLGIYEYTTDSNGKIIRTIDLTKKPSPTLVSSYISNGRAYNKLSDNSVKVAKNSWVKVSGKDFRTDSNGQVLYGIHKIGNYFYHLTYNGISKGYKVYVNKHLYSFDNTGKGYLVSSNYTPVRDLDVAIGWMKQAMNFHYQYSMHWQKRNQIGYADCSSAVYRAMKHGGFISKNVANGNTETLFELGRRGQILKQISENQIRYGDIFVAGVPGKSLGAGGHTGFILDKNTIIHCNYADYGVSITQRKGRMGDKKYPVRYYRLVGAR